MHASGVALRADVAAVLMYCTFCSYLTSASSSCKLPDKTFTRVGKIDGTETKQDVDRAQRTKERRIVFVPQITWVVY